MSLGPGLLIASAAAVGILHTLVPDHWVPIAVLAKRFGWTRFQTGRAAAVAGVGHTLSTLAIGVVVWIAGLSLAVRFGNLLSAFSGIALVGFGLWIAIGALRQVRGPAAARTPGGERSLLLILGSSPMVEVIPAFFAAARYGKGVLVLMALSFSVTTIATYVVLSVGSHAALQRVSFGPLERYGEAISGAIVAIVGVVFLIWSPA